MLSRRFSTAWVRFSITRKLRTAKPTRQRCAVEGGVHGPPAQEQDKETGTFPDPPRREPGSLRNQLNRGWSWFESGKLQGKSVNRVIHAALITVISWILNELRPWPRIVSAVSARPRGWVGCRQPN